MGRQNATDEMVDFEVPEPEAVVSEAVVETAAPAAPKKKDDLPEGWITPTALAKIVDLKPQQVYGYVKNGKGFPFKNHTDGRFIVALPAEGTEGHGDPATDGLAWILDRRARTEAKKAEKAAEVSTENSQPEVVSEPDFDIEG